MNSHQENAYITLDGHPVFHIAENKWSFKKLTCDYREIASWGQLYSPSVVMASYEIGGMILLGLDTRVDGYCALWADTRIESESLSLLFDDDDDDDDGDDGDDGDESYARLVAWTPIATKESLRKIGFRLVHAHLCEMFYCKPPEWCVSFEWNSNNLPSGTKEVAWLLGAISPTVHLTADDLQKTLEQMPEYLRALYSKRASIGDVRVDYVEKHWHSPEVGLD